MNSEVVPFSESSMEPLPDSPVGGKESPPSVDPAKPSKHVIDTAVPFESVKDAVFKFGGRVDWKSRRTQSLERSKLAGEDFGKSDTAEELENTKKFIEDLKLELERVEKDELEANEEAVHVVLKIEELDQGIINEATLEAMTQVEVEKAMHVAAVSELEFFKKELESLQNEYASMESAKDIAVSNAEEAVAVSRQIEKAVEDLTAELIATKEALNLTRNAHLEAEDKRSGVVDHSMKLELEQAEEELERLNQQVMASRVLKSKLEASSSLLLDLKADLAAYMESKLKEDSCKKQKDELEEIKLNIEKATSGVNSLREASMSLKSKLEEEKMVLSTLRQREEMTSATVETLQTELEKSKAAAAFLLMKENEAREMMTELPKKLQRAAQETDEAKSLAQAAQAELLEAQKEVEQAKAKSATLENSLMAAQKEIEAAKAAEMLAKDAITALEKSESAKSNNEKNASSLVTLTLDEYHELSKRAFKAEEQANARIEAAKSQIQIARESELRSLERLEELNEELCVRRESLKIATENAEKASEGKSAAEQELRAWQNRQEQEDYSAEFSDHIASPTESPHDDSSSSNGKVPLNDTEPGSASDPKTKKKKKKSFFPSKVVMFFAKKKTHPAK